MYGTLVDGAKSSSQEESRQTEQQQKDDELKARNRARSNSHCHVQFDVNSTGAAIDIDQVARRRLITASAMCLVFMIGELVGGVLSNSLAIATDAAHLLTDFASFMISLFALWLSGRPASGRMSFGWHRAEVLGALVSVLMIWLVTGLLVLFAIERLRSGQFEVDSTVMVITASVGLLVNVFMAVALHDGFGGHGHAHSHSHAHQSHARHKHSHQMHLHDDEQPPSHGAVVSATLAEVPIGAAKHQHGLLAKSLSTTAEPMTLTETASNSSGRKKQNINVRAAFIHVVGDFLQSLGVLIAALVIHFEPNYAIIDPICTFFFSAIVLCTTLGILGDAINVLLEGTPDGINVADVRRQLGTLPHVVRVHNLRIWSLSLDKVALSAHLVIDARQTDASTTLKLATEHIKQMHDIFEITIQVEELQDEMKNCQQCRDDVDTPTLAGVLVVGAKKSPAKQTLNLKGGDDVNNRSSMA